MTVRFGVILSYASLGAREEEVAVVVAGRPPDRDGIVGFLHFSLALFPCLPTALPWPTQSLPLAAEGHWAAGGVGAAAARTETYIRIRHMSTAAVSFTLPNLKRLASVRRSSTGG